MAVGAEHKLIVAGRRTPTLFPCLAGSSFKSAGLHRRIARIHAIDERLEAGPAMFSLTPTVPHSSLPSLDSISTRVLAAVPVAVSRMRTL